ncbi:hypothetical protein Lser_V15G03852 [Lactuca serriola]
MLSTRKRYEPIVSDFQTPDPPVEMYEYQEEVYLMQEKTCTKTISTCKDGRLVGHERTKEEWTLPFTVVPTSLATALDINLSNASLIFISVTFATMSPGTVEAAIRNLPPSVVGDPSNLDVMGLLAMEAIVEQVRDGSCFVFICFQRFSLSKYLLLESRAPSLWRSTTQEPTIPTEVPSEETNGENNNLESRGPLTSDQRISASLGFNEVSPDPYGREAKHFTEIRVLNRDVRIVLEGVDKFSNLIASVYYSDGESTKDLAMELIENGYAKYVEWSASMMEDEARRKLEAAELLAKKTKLGIWTNYVPPASNSKAISDNFTKKKSKSIKYQMPQIGSLVFS